VGSQLYNVLTPGGILIVGHLLAVFWQGQDTEVGEDAIVTVSDGVVVYIGRADGFQVRLLAHEVEALHDFMLSEICSHEAGEAITNFRKED
jgi:hypothetical protein